MKLAIARFYQAHPTNYTPGRVSPIRKFVVHHSAGWEATLRHLWADPSRNASSTFWVGNILGAIEQYLDTNDTPWTNGNLSSNRESLTVETRGDWRGFYDGNTLKNLEDLMLACLKIWPHLVLEFHMDVSDRTTLCPADLKHKGYAVAAWNRAKARLNAAPAPAPKPAPAAITYRKITPKRIQLTKNANLWNFNFNSWDAAKAVDQFAAGHLIDVVAIAKNSLGGEYYMTAYSYNNGSIRATNGFNVKDAKDYVNAPIPQPQPGPVPPVQPPAVTPTWEAMSQPRKLKMAIDGFVINLDTKEKVGSVIAKGTEVAFVQKINTDKMYLRSEWAKANGKNWGVPFDQLEEISEPVNEPIPEKPIDVDPNTPGEGDVEIRLTAIEKAMDILKPGWRK